MKYISTRNSNNTFTASQAILMGQPRDGGLFVPAEMPPYSLDWSQWSEYSYEEMAFKVLRPFLSDYSKDQLQHCIQLAYRKHYNHPLIAPLRKVDDDFYLELFHGPTASVKDLPTLLLGHLMTEAAWIQNMEDRLVYMNATGGDLGRALMDGLADIDGAQVVAFYAKAGVTSLLEKQLVAPSSDHAHAVSILGSYSQIQDEIGRMLTDTHLLEQFNEAHTYLTTAGATNIGFVLAHLVYYFYAYAQLIRQRQIEPGEPVDFTIPTGHMSSLLAGYYAKSCGLPIGKLVCATNDNRQLAEFLNSGTYTLPDRTNATLSASIDVAFPLNFERWLYHVSQGSVNDLAAMMTSLRQDGQFTLNSQYHDALDDIYACSVSNDDTYRQIRRTFDQHIYLMDPHAAVASAAMNTVRSRELLKNKQVILATASPYKYPEAVLKALNISTDGKTDYQILDLMTRILQNPIPPCLSDAVNTTLPCRYTVEVSDMADYLRQLFLH